MKLEHFGLALLTAAVLCTQLLPAADIDWAAPLGSSMPIPQWTIMLAAAGIVFAVGALWTRERRLTVQPRKMRRLYKLGETVVSGGDEPTKVRIRGNTVLVPVTLSCGGHETEVHLVLDTGASRTTISTDVADQLSVNLDKERKARVQVVGGAVIEARVVRMNSLTVGPHIKRNWDVFVVPHKGPASGYDGLLGMDVLRGLKYRVDFKKQLIIWE